MSHIVVMVVGDNPEEKLAPYHEFECTGQIDEYVQNIDITEKTKSDYLSSKARKIKDKEGHLYDPWDERFYREPTPTESKKIGKIGSGHVDGISYGSREWNDGLGYRPKVSYIPEGFEEVEVPYVDLMSFRDYIENDCDYKAVNEGEMPDLEDDHKYGYYVVDKKGDVVRVVDRTNPNAKWDWYSIGGRWEGFFKLKNGKKSDSALKSDIDINGMLFEKEEKAAADYDRLAGFFDGEIPTLKYKWKDVLSCERFKDLDIDEKRAIYHAQKPLEEIDRLTNDKTLSKDDIDFLSWLEFEEYQCSRSEYIAKARRSAMRTFAIVIDNVWHERGEMGWFGCVHEEKAEDVWNEEFERLFNSIPDNTLLTIVDCHI